METLWHHSRPESNTRYQSEGLCYLGDHLMIAQLAMRQLQGSAEGDPPTGFVTFCQLHQA